MTRNLSFLSPLHLLLYCCPHALNPPLHLPKSLHQYGWTLPHPPAFTVSLSCSKSRKNTHLFVFSISLLAPIFSTLTQLIHLEAPSLLFILLPDRNLHYEFLLLFSLPHTANPAQFILFSLSYFPMSSLLCQYFSHLLRCHLSSSSFISLSFHPSSCHNSNPAVQGAITSPTLSFFLCPIPLSPLLTL